MTWIARKGGPGILAILVVLGQIKANPLLAWIEIDLTILVVGMVVVAIAASMISDGRPSGRVSIPIIVWACFLPATGITLTWDSYATTKILTLFSVTLLLAIAPFFLMRTPQQQRVFLTVSVVVAMLSLGYALIFGDPANEAGRLEFDGANTIGSARIAMAGAVIVVIAAFGPQMRPVARVIFALVGLAAAGAAVLTGSRGPVVAAAGALIVTALFAPGLRRYRGRMFLGLLAIGGTVFLVTRSSGGFDRILGLFENENDSSSGVRQQLVDYAILMTHDSPLGTGWGTFTFRDGYYRYPHNLFAELGAEAGVLVLTVVALGLIATVFRAARGATTNTSVIMLALLIFGIINAMVSGDVNASRLMVVVIFTVWAMPRISDSEKAARSSQGAAKKSPVSGSVVRPAVN